MMSAYAFSIQYPSLARVMRALSITGMIIYIPFLGAMLIVAGVIRDIRWTVDESWPEIVDTLNDDQFCTAFATTDPDDPCKDELLAVLEPDLKYALSMSIFLAAVGGGGLVFNILY